MDELVQFTRDKYRERLLIVLVAAAVLLLFLLLNPRAPDDLFRNALFRLRGPLPIGKSDFTVIVIAVDQHTDDALAESWGRYPYPPALYAELLAKISWDITAGSDVAPPEAIALEMPVGDEEFAAMTEALDSVIWHAGAVRVIPDSAGNAGPPPAWALAEEPHPPRALVLPDEGVRWVHPAPAQAERLNAHADRLAAYRRVLATAPTAARVADEPPPLPWGIMASPREGAAPRRHMPLAFAFRGEVYPEFAFALARACRGEDYTMPQTDASGLLPINFVGPLRTPDGQRLLSPRLAAIAVYSLAEVLDMPEGEARRVFGSSTDRDLQQRTGVDGKRKIVLVGTALPGVVEYTPTPFDPVVHYPVETLAHVLRMHLDGDYLKPTSGWYPVLLLVLIAIVLWMYLPNVSAITGTLMIGGLLAGLLGFAWFAFAVHHYQVSVLMPVMALIVLYPLLMICRLAREERRRYALQRHFTQYLSTDLVLQLMESPRRVSLEGQLQDVTVVFADLRNFTAWAAEQTPLEVIAQLNEIFVALSRIIEEYGGSVDKFIGDEIMALFGAPLALENHARSAVLAALEMQERLDDMGRDWALEGRHVFQMGVAVHTGDAVVGDIGAEVRRNYTAIGSIVNIAARLEEKTKELGVRILATRATMERVGDDVDYREIGSITLRSVSQALLVYEVLGRKGFYTPAGKRDIAGREE